MDNSINSGIFSVRVYLNLIPKDSVTHTHGLAVFVNERLSFTPDLSLEKSVDSHLWVQLALPYSVSYIYFRYQSLFSSLCTIFEAISCNIAEILSISPSANMVVFEGFSIHYKDWLTCSGGTERPYLK